MRKLATASVLLLGLLAFLGAGESTYRGGSYGTAGATYQAGGVAAGWDTLRNVYSTRTGMGDTLIANAAYDTFNTRWQAAKARADAVVRWGSADPTFAYALIDTYYAGIGSWPTTASRATELRPKAMGWGTVTYPTPTATRWTLNDSVGGVHGRSLLVHFDPQLPSGITVVSAKLHLCALNWTSSAVVDTMVATLMTAPADSVWWRHKGITSSGTETAPNMSKASYRYQWFAAGGTNYGYTNASNGNTPTAGWYPALSERARWWQWGDVSDWTPAPSLSAAGGDVAIDVTNCVQAIANGRENNGLHIVTGKNTTSDRLRRIINFDTATTGGSAFYVPWLEVKYVTKRTTPFPGGKEIALVFQTDDGREAFNDTLVTIFGNNGGKFTAFLCDSLTRNSPTCATYTEAAEWHDSGVVEIGYHSKHHRAGPASEYLTVYEKSGITADKMNLLRNQMNPETLWAAADSIGRPDLRASPYWGRSMALPGYPFSATVVNVAQEFGYNALRVGTLIPFTTASGANYVLASWRKAACDTARGHMPYGGERAPRNMMLLPLTMEINQIVGEKANTTITEAQVKANMRRLLRQAKAQDRLCVSLYEHDTKSGGYTYGIDPEEMRWMLQEAVAQNAWICTASEYAAWVRSGSAAVATPVGYAQPDSFRFTAEQGVWYKPNGIDNRWIRGVK